MREVFNYQGPQEAAGPGAHKRAKSRRSDALVSDTDLEGEEREALNKGSGDESVKDKEMSSEEK